MPRSLGGGRRRRLQRKRGEKMSPLSSQPPDTHTIGTNLTVQYCGGWILPPPPPHVSSSSSSVPPLSDLLATAVRLRRPSSSSSSSNPIYIMTFFPSGPPPSPPLPFALIPSCVAVAPPPPPPPPPRIWSGGLPEVVVGIKCFGGGEKEGVDGHCAVMYVLLRRDCSRNEKGRERRYGVA